MGNGSKTFGTEGIINKHMFTQMKHPIITFQILLIFLMLTYIEGAAQSDVYFGEKKIVPKIPPKNERIRVIIVSDATNEIDDLWAISLAILSPERFDIEGFVGSNYDHTHNGIGPRSIEMSVKEIHTILEKAGMKGKYPVFPGSHPMQYEFAPGNSEGVDFIIKRATSFILSNFKQ